MTIKAVVKIPGTIIPNSTSATGVQTTPVISLKNNVGGVSQQYVHNLVDVIENNPVDGATLVYNADLDKYEVKLPEIAAVAVDGGSF